jgi:hypothetical protein
MLQQFTTFLRAASTVLALGLLAMPLGVEAQDMQLADKAPGSYTVQKGDTLWGISGKFLKDPWRWPDVWRMNRDQIRNPHLIYPGDVVTLSYVDGRPMLSLNRPAMETVRLSPGVRIEAIGPRPIPSIPPADIEAFLTKPIITGPNGFEKTGQIVSARNRERVVRGAGDVVYALGLDPKLGDYWYIYRPTGPVFRLGTDEILGYESLFLGTARVDKFGELSTVRIESSEQEILVGDRMIPAPREIVANFVPRAPDKPIDAQIIKVPFGGTETGRGYVVTLDRGYADGVEPGHVLAIYRIPAPVVDPRETRKPYEGQAFPEIAKKIFGPKSYVYAADERTGLLFVFRAFDKVSYALVLNSVDPVTLGDRARTP